MARLAVTVLCALLTLTFGACSGPPPSAGNSGGESGSSGYSPDADDLINPASLFEPFPDDAPERADREAVLTRHLSGEPRTLNPLFVNSWFDFYLAVMLYGNLYTRDINLDWVPNPDRIAKVEESEDRLRTTIHLAPGQTWHDGRPFTSADVRFTWEAINDPQVPAYYYKHMVGQITAVEIIDDLTFTFVHEKASPAIYQNMGFYIIPKHIFGNPEELANDPSMTKSAYYTRYNREEVVGSGPYTFVEWKSADRIVVERWEDYPFRKPHFRRQILKVIPDRNAALLEFRKGQLDEIWLTPIQFATQTNDDAYRDVGVKAYGVRRMFAFIGWNMDGSNPFFEDKRVRHALAYAHDADRVIEVSSYGLYTRSTGIFDPEHWGYNPDPKPWAFDLDRAAALLDEAGWLVSEEDGYRYKTIGGEPVRFHFELLMAKSFEYSMPGLDVYRDDLRKIGVGFDVRLIENAAFESRYLRHEFQAIQSVWEVTNDPSQWRNHFHSAEHEAGRNVSGFKNARVDELFDLTDSTFDREDRAAYFREMQAIIFEEQPHLFLWDYSLLHGFNKNLRGVTKTPGGVFLFRPAESGWWLPADAAR